MTGKSFSRTVRLEEFRERLRSAREELFRTVARTDEELAALEGRQRGVTSQDDPSAELATAILSRLEGRERHALDELDAAQARLEAGTFGACEQCSHPIPLGRLRAVPVARHCLACQVKQER